MRALTVVVVASNALGNAALDWGVKGLPGGIRLAPWALARAVFNPWVGLGIGLLALWMLTRMTLLSWADLSFVLPVTSAGYVATALVGRYVFGERVAGVRWAGTALIAAGVALVSTTRERTGSAVGETD